MAKQLPGLPRHALSYTPWRYSSSTDIYGTSGGWTQAINTGGGVIPGYRRATEPLRTFGAALANIPANQVERVKTGYATVELTDAANLHGIEVLGLQRAKAKANERAILELEAATLSTADEMNTHIAVLNKINAAGMMAVRASQDTNQLLVAVLEHQVAESKRRRNAEAARMADTVALWTRARGVAERGHRGTTLVLSAQSIPWSGLLALPHFVTAPYGVSGWELVSLVQAWIRPMETHRKPWSSATYGWNGGMGSQKTAHCCLVHRTSHPPASTGQISPRHIHGCIQF